MSIPRLPRTSGSFQDVGDAHAPTAGAAGGLETGLPAAQEPPLDGLHLSVSAVARRIGVAPATLRTWDRRYGLGPTEHSTGRHRRYAPQDVARLELMQRALVQGASPAEAARWVAHADVSGIAPAATSPAPGRDDPERRWDRPGDHGAVLIPAGDDNHQTDARVRTGGTVLRMPGATRQARGLARAVLAMDAQAAQRLLVHSTSTIGVVRTWDDVIRPVMGAVSERWGHTGSGIEVEHLVSEVVTSVLSGALIDTPQVVSARPVLLGSMPGERHSLPLRALSATLGRRGVATSLLGADLPVDSLIAAVHRTGPAAVFLWAQLEGNADPGAVDRLPRTRPRTRCYVGGPGWDRDDLPDGVVLLSSLGEADNVLAAAAGV